MTPTFELVRYALEVDLQGGDTIGRLTFRLPGREGRCIETVCSGSVLAAIEEALQGGLESPEPVEVPEDPPFSEDPVTRFTVQPYRGADVTAYPFSSDADSAAPQAEPKSRASAPVQLDDDGIPSL